MKFIAKTSAPDIPLEILDALESDKLVFFCGAGISYPADLPGFKGLVDGVYDDLSIKKNDIETSAYKAQLYDRCLSLLESRVMENKPRLNYMRRSIIDRLRIAPKADLTTHQAILELSRTSDDKYRIVTTNVDHGFPEASDLLGLDLICDSAPRVPVPKPHKWNSAVHLHGLIDEQHDPDGGSLIFTSGDFGSAYLTERWASKFVTELFSHFTVLFVGYSVNDPVIRYMTDAIAADRLAGYEHFNQPYVISHAPPSKLKEQAEEWDLKGIKPILYSYRHDNLHNTLKAWARSKKDGLGGKSALISTKAKNPPLPPFDQDESISQVVETIQENSAGNGDGVTGHLAEVFSKLQPAAPIEWLPVFDAKGLLSLSKDAEGVLASYQSAVYGNLVMPNPITLNLWQWLAIHHLESQELVDWVIKGGAYLHPEFKDAIRRELRTNKDKIKQSYKVFWTIVTSQSLLLIDDQTAIYSALDDLAVEVNTWTTNQLLQCLSPRYALSKANHFRALEQEHKVFDIDVTIGLKDHHYESLIAMPAYKELLGILLPVTNLLKQAMEMMETVGLIEKEYDRSYWHLASIEPHEQNNRYEPWVILIEICRDLFDHAVKDNLQLATNALEIWKNQPYPAFRRLAFYAYHKSSIGNPKEKLSYLLEDNGYWLWSTSTQREKFRLLSSLWPEMNDHQALELEAKIITGPLRSMFRGDLTDEEWQFRFDRDRWHLLAKLERFNRPLLEGARNLLMDIKDRYPDWRLEEGERDEFVMWSSSSWGNRVDTTEGELFDNDAEEVIELLSSVESDYADGRLDVFRNACKNPDLQPKALDVLTLLMQDSNWSSPIWHAALSGFSNAEDCKWEEMGELLSSATDAFISDEGWSITYWFSKASKSVISTGRYDLFWGLAEKIVETNHDSVLVDSSDTIHSAINHPAGILLEALLFHFGELKIPKEAGLPEQSLNILSKVLDQQRSDLMMGRVILASRVTYFYWVDPDWTTSYLFPLFDFSKSTEAIEIWKGYLWGARVSIDIAIELKTQFLEAFMHTEEFGEVEDNLHQFFTLLSIDYPDLFTDKEKREVIDAIGENGLSNIADFLFTTTRASKAEKDTYWVSHISPFLKAAWPKIGVSNNSVSKSFAFLALQLTDNFENAVKQLIPLMSPFSDLNYFVRELSKSGHVQRHPSVSLDLLHAIFSEEYQWPGEELTDALKTIASNAPKLEEDSKFIRIREFAIAHAKYL